jgi:AraC family transcriptional regulator
MQQPRIETIKEKKLIGIRTRLNLLSSKNGELWQRFMPRRKEIKNAINLDIISMEVYDKELDFKTFNPNTEFEKWAAVEVSDFNSIPEGMEAYSLSSGQYAVFLYKGAANAYAKAFSHIFETWLPASAYLLDSRPHFEVMGEKYKGNDPGSEEEIWVPVSEIEVH